MGPIGIPSVNGHRYFLTIVDDHTRHTWIYFIKSKAETKVVLYNCVIYVKD